MLLALSTFWWLLILAPVAFFLVFLFFVFLGATVLQQSVSGFASTSRFGTWYRANEVSGNAGFPAEKTSRRPKLPRTRFKGCGTPGDAARLGALGMPVLRSTDDLLAWLKIDIRELVLLANPGDHVRPRRMNYHEWSVPKKRWGVRIISSPKPRLKRLQRRIQREILDRAPVHDAAHGFVRTRGIRTNAERHVGQPLVVNFDLRDFFQHVRYRQVVGVFRSLGYGSEVAHWLALLCTHRPALGPAMDQKHRIGVKSGTFDVFRPARHAPQGAPTSPTLANLAARRLDRRLTGLAQRFRATYTRYADDMSFSGGEEFKLGQVRFLHMVPKIAHDCGFRTHDLKCRHMRSGRRQQVTGVVVNQKVNCSREEYDRLKAIIHNASRSGLASQNRDNHPDFRGYLLGCAAHVAQLNPQRGRRLMEQVRQLS